MSKRVLLTGVGGFIGSHLLRWILERTDWEVIGIESWRPGRKSSSFRLQEALAPLSPSQRSRLTIYPWDLTHPFSVPFLQKLDFKTIEVIVSMASDSAVTKSVHEPGDCWYNNCQLAYHMLELARQCDALEMFVQVSTDEVYGDAGWDSPGHHEWDTILPSNPYSASKAAQEALAIAYWRTYQVPVVITNCYDMQTRVMTPDGFKGKDELKEGDLVWAMDSEERMVLEPVQRLVQMSSGGKMVRFSGVGVDQLVTPNHRMMIRRAIGKPRRWGAVEETTADELLKGLRGRVRVPRNGSWDGYSAPTFQPYLHIPGFEGKSKKQLPTVMDSETVAALFGWYVSEGNLCGRTTVCFGAASDRQYDAIEYLLQGIEGEIYKNGRSIRIANQHLAELLSLCGAGAKNKTIPEFIRAWDTDLLRVFFEAATAGDGTWYGTSAVYYTSSEPLTCHMAEVAMKLGYAVRISERKTRHPSKDELVDSFVIRCSAAKGEIEPRNITEEPYDGGVWCLSVPSGRVFVERNGCVSLSGQTMNVIGEWQDPEKFLPLALKRISLELPMTLFGEPDGKTTSQRVWLDVKNMAAALTHVVGRTQATRYEGAEDRPCRYHVIGDTELSVRQLATKIAEQLDKPLIENVVQGDQIRPGYDRRYALIDNHLKQTGFRPPYTFDQTLERIIQWAKDNPHWLYE